MDDVYLKKWNYAGEHARLEYSDGTEVYVSKADFDRAFGCIVSAPKASVIRDFAMIVMNAATKNETEPQKERKLIDPKRYPAIIRKLKRRICARSGKEVASLDIDGVCFEAHGVNYMINRSWFIFSKNGKTPFIVNTTTYNGKVAAVEVEIPLFFDVDHREVPAYKLMEHIDRLLDTCGKELGIQTYVGPIYNSDKDPIKLNTKADVEKISDAHYLKYADISRVRNGLGAIEYACLDSDGSLWLIDLSYATLSSEFAEEINFPNECFVLRLRKFVTVKAKEVLSKIFERMR